MGIFGRVFGKKSGTVPQEGQLPWIPLDEMAQLAEIKARSQERPQLIFKHSATCGTSAMVLRMFSSSVDPQGDHDLYFLTIQANRELSRAVEDTFGVRHESPQLLILDKGEITFHASHGAIADADLGQYLN